LNRGRHLYSAGRPSRWALADISSLNYFVFFGKNMQHLSEKTISGFTVSPGSAEALVGEVGK